MPKAEHDLRNRESHGVDVRRISSRAILEDTENTIGVVTGMIFVPCNSGISQNEIEKSSRSIKAGCNVLLVAFLTV
jgi:hypothetical protein